MKLIRILLTVAFCLGQLGISYALDWKRLHQEADNKSLARAISAVELKPGSIEELYILGLVYLNLHKDTEAQFIFKRIIELDPKLEEPRWGLAETLRRQNKIAESEKILNALIKSKPDFSPAYITLAYIEYTKTDFTKTVRLAKKVIMQGKEEVDLSNYTRAYLLFAGGKGMLASNGGPLAKVINGTQVLPNLKRAEALQPDSPAVLFALGSFYFLAPGIAGGNKDLALKYLEKAIERDPLFADAYVRLAQVYQMQGDTEKYQQYLNQAFQIDPNNALAKDAKNKVCKFNCVTVQE